MKKQLETMLKEDLSFDEIFDSFEEDLLSMGEIIDDEGSYLLRITFDTFYVECFLEISLRGEVSVPLHVSIPPTDEVPGVNTYNYFRYFTEDDAVDTYAMLGLEG